MSHLFSATSVAQLERIASSATRRSSEVRPSEASQTTIATSARAAARSGSKLRVVRDRAGDLPPAPQTRGVDHVTPATLDLGRGIDRVAGRSPSSDTITRSVPRERVEERRLADVRLPDDRQPDRVVVIRRAPPTRDELRDPVEQVTGAVPVRRRDGLDPKPQLVELRREVDVRRARRPCSRPRSPRRRRRAAARRARRRRPAVPRGRRRRGQPHRRRRPPRAPDPGPRPTASPRRPGPRRRCRRARTEPHSVSIALRSRVTPASAWTTASTPPGEPVGRGCSCPRSGTRLPRPGEGGLRAAGSTSLARGRAADLLDDLGYRLPGGCRARPQAVGGVQRAVLALAVPQVALLLRLDDARTTPRIRWRGAVLFSSLAVRNTLSGSVGTDHRADIPALRRSHPT